MEFKEDYFKTKQAFRLRLRFNRFAYQNSKLNITYLCAPNDYCQDIC